MAYLGFDQLCEKIVIISDWPFAILILEFRKSSEIGFSLYHIDIKKTNIHSQLSCGVIVGIDRTATVSMKLSSDVFVTGQHFHP